jgi:hypothetical protein
MRFFNTKLGRGLLSAGKSIAPMGSSLWWECLKKERINHDLQLNEYLEKGYSVLEGYRAGKDLRGDTPLIQKKLKLYKRKPEVSLLLAALRIEQQRYKNRDKDELKEMVNKFTDTMDNVIEQLKEERS